MEKIEIRKYDKIWSKLILLQYKYCFRCGGSDAMAPHHIVKRRKHSARWDLRNGIGLCRACHCFAENWPIDFIIWLMAKKGHWGKKWLEALVRKGTQAGNKIIIEKDIQRLLFEYQNSGKLINEKLENG